MNCQNEIVDLLGDASGSDKKDKWIMAAKADSEHLAEYSLVLSAVGIDHRLDSHIGVILVCENKSERALFELQAFREENCNWPPPFIRSRPAVRSDNPPTLLLIVGLILFYSMTGPWFSGNPWFQVGAVSSEAILEQNQWWRLVTALTLHADQMHLVGNSVIGGVMVHLLCKTIGYGTAWLTLLLSGLIGNLLNILLRTEPHYSVGFSTAIFAAIGIFCGRSLGRDRSSLMRQLILPLGTGIGMLAMLGSGGQRTDLGAHLFGLATGFFCGMLLRLLGLDLQGEDRPLQRILFSAAVALILFCWMFAAGEGLGL